MRSEEVESSFRHKFGGVCISRCCEQDRKVYMHVRTAKSIKQNKDILLYIKYLQSKVRACHLVRVRVLYGERFLPAVAHARHSLEMKKVRFLVKSPNGSGRSFRPMLTSLGPWKVTQVQNEPQCANAHAGYKLCSAAVPVGPTQIAGIATYRRTY